MRQLLALVRNIIVLNKDEAEALYKAYKMHLVFYINCPIFHFIATEHF